MTGALGGILLAFLLSATSLVLVLFRVSPLTAPEFALPFFFLSVFIVVSSGVALVLSIVKSLLALSRAYIGSSLRQGILLGSATCLVLLLFLLHILNWWIALLIYTVAFLIEMAVGR